MSDEQRERFYLAAQKLGTVARYLCESARCDSFTDAQVIASRLNEASLAIAILEEHLAALLSSESGWTALESAKEPTPDSSRVLNLAPELDIHEPSPEDIEELNDLDEAATNAELRLDDAIDARDAEPWVPRKGEA